MAIKLLIGGSPCTHWSIAQKNNRETENSGKGWELFKNFIITKEKFKPDFFLYENVKSMSNAIKAEITKELGVEPYLINSALVSAQNRQRYYWTNIENVPQPEDRGILLKDILEYGFDLSQRDKSYCLTATYNGATAINTLEKKQRPMVAEPVRVGCYPRKYYICPATGNEKTIYQVRDGLICIKGKQYPIKLADGFYIIRKLTVTECCRLQTMPDDYCKAVSATQAYKALGNGWTAEVIIHLLNHALKDVPRNEEIVVLSLSMMELVRVDIVWIRWGSPMSNITHTKLTNTQWQSQTTITPTLFNAEMRLQFERIVGNPLRLALSGWMIC